MRMVQRRKVKTNFGLVMLSRDLFLDDVSEHAGLPRRIRG